MLQGRQTGNRPSEMDNRSVSRSQTDDLNGRAHRQALEVLLGHHDEVASRARPSVMVLEGAPGVGKSRLLLELYRALSRRQAAPRYWPEPDGSWNGYPAAVRPVDAKMPYFWWGIPCPPAGRARAFQVLGDEITQIEAHAALLIAADQAGEVLADATWDYVTEVATGVVTDLLPGSATAVALGRSLLRVLRARGRVWTLGEQLLEGMPIDATDLDRDDLVARALDALSELADLVPVVLTVDDAQSADVSLARLLMAASALRAPIQIVIATQAAASGLHPLGALLNSVPDERRLVLGNLEQDDAVGMVTTRIPRAPRDVVLAIARKSVGSPRSIETLLSLLPVRDGSVAAALADVEGLPDDYADQLRRLWSDTLPQATKEILSAAAAVCTDEGDLVPRLLVGALTMLRPDRPREADLDEAVVRFQWLLRSASMVRFAQPQHQLVAAERSVLMQGERQELVGMVVGTLVELTRSGEIEALGAREKRALLETHVRFAREGWSHDHMADADAAFNLSLILEKIGDEQEALSLREQSIAWAVAAGVGGQALVNLRSSLFGLLMQNERPDDAEALLRELVDAAAPGSLWSAVAPMSAIVLAMRRDGVTEGRVAELAGVVEAFDEHDPLGRAAISGHVNLAFFLNRLGRPHEALGHHRLVKQRLEANPNAQVDTTVFQTEVNIASTLRGSDGLDAAMVAFDALDAGPLDYADAQRACLARLRVLHAAAAAREAEELVDHLTAALPRSLTLLGARHRDVRASVNVLGDLLLSKGAFHEAIDLYRRHPAPIDLASADDIDLSSAFNHASGLMRLQRQADAVPILDGVVRRATGLLGEDHELTITALAHLIDAAIDAEETEVAARATCAWMLGLGAKDEWKKASSDRLSQLDGLLSGNGRPGAVPTLLLPAREMAAARRDAIALLYLSQWMAGLFGQAGKMETAKELAAEAAEIAAVLEHEETRLACQLTVAEACRMLDELDEAMAVYRGIDEQVGDILGDDHAIGMFARERLQELGG
jgi:tetratricopeptide (TPR) repeat protein